jgi:hypothetical protein
MQYTTRLALSSVAAASEEPLGERGAERDFHEPRDLGFFRYKWLVRADGPALTLSYQVIILARNQRRERYRRYAIPLLSSSHISREVRWGNMQ